MPLNEREQKILEEIERQFRAEDPDLVRAASSMPMRHFATHNRNLLGVGVVLGMVIMLGTFSFNTIFALIGFLLMVASATGLVQAMRGAVGASSEDPSDAGSVSSARNRWPFRR